jgi:hypothetical protein
VVLLVALGTVGYERSARQAAEGVAARAAAEMARIDGKLREVQRQAVTAEQRVSETRAALATVEAAATRSAAAQPVAVDPNEAGAAFLAKHPEARELWDERERANLAAILGPVYRKLDLSAAQREQVESIMMRAISGMTVVDGPDGPMSLRREAALTRAEAEAQMQGVLGAEVYQRFQDLAKLGPTFDLTVKLATALYRTEPLSREQTDGVMQIFADASPVGKNAKPGQTGIDWKELKAQASAVLSPGQLVALEGLQRNFEYQQALVPLRRQTAEAMRNQKNATPPSR